MEPRTAPYGIPNTSNRPISAFNLASPEERARMIPAIPQKEKLNYKRAIGQKKRATAKQLVALEKARAKRAEKQKRQATPKQLEALAKGRAKRAEKKKSSATCARRRQRGWFVL